ncbi:MAG: P-loop NTPase fold protein [Cyanobacteria bacterium P01_B01_bin.77]
MDIAKARTLKEAYRACELRPLTAEQMEMYYVPFAARHDVMGELNFTLDLLEPGETKSVLFTGHVGCGKSSELTRLSSAWHADYLVIPVQIEDEADPNDLTYTDLYLLVIKQVELALRRQRLAFDAALLQSFENWFKEITKETETTVERSVNVNAEASLGSEAPFLAKFLVKVMAQIKGGSKDKVTIRQTLEREVSRLRTDINNLLRNGAQKLRQAHPEKKGILLILDGLDKCPPKVATQLFIDYSAQLRELACNIIYTVPIAVLYGTRKLGSTFENPHIIPMIGMYQPERTAVELAHDAAGLEQMALLIEKRIDSDAIFAERALLLDLAKASGGHLRQMMRMTRKAIAIASSRGNISKKVESDDITYAINQEQQGFERILSADDYGELARVAMTKELTDESLGQAMLFNTAILEYNGAGRWIYPNPVVMRSESFKRALTQIQQSD